MTRHSFLIYANRSGSTLLSTQLSERVGSRQLLVVPEFRVIEYLFHIGDTKARALRTEDIRRMIDDDRQVTSNLGLSPETLLTTLESARGEGIRGQLRAVTRAYMAHNSWVGDPEMILWKWGNAATYVHEIGQVFPDAKFVHVVRDARAVVNSLLAAESPYFPGESLARGSTLHGVHHWKTSLRRNARPVDVGMPMLEMRYRELVETPDDVCRRVEAFLGVDEGDGRDGDSYRFNVSATEKGIHRLVNQVPQPQRIDGWRTELPDWRRYVVEHAAGTELRALGYPISPGEASWPKRLGWLGRAYLERLVGLLQWASRRFRRYRAPLAFRLVRLRAKAWLATKATKRLR